MLANSALNNDDRAAELASAEAVRTIIAPQKPTPPPSLPLLPFRTMAEMKRDTSQENVLIDGRWLKRGGIALIVSTTGSGKSILQTQSALSWAAGISCCGLRAVRPFKCMVIQSEDDDDRVAWDRDDVTEYLQSVHPEFNWVAAWKLIRFVDFSGLVGAEFINRLDIELSQLNSDTFPDCVIINPMNAYFGGNLKEGADCSAFFKGGSIHGEKTIGLEAVVKKHNIGCIIYAHTPKPPTKSAELKDWLTNPYACYQMCGANEIADAVRSIMTFLRVPEQPKGENIFSFLAGKNGSGLGWKDAQGEPTLIRYFKWGDNFKHYWQESDPPTAAPAKAKESRPKDDAEILATHLRSNPTAKSQIPALASVIGITRDRTIAAWNLINSGDNISKYGLCATTKGEGRKAYLLIGPIPSSEPPETNELPLETEDPII